MKRTKKTTLDILAEIAAYHEEQAKYWEFTWKTSWGRCASQRKAQKQSEIMHKKYATTICKFLRSKELLCG